ncbi:MAG: hypothetical protein M3R25_01660 [Bacteroidota bacterium]|nr:hypothetical protein [Bacteroidota bacterium]
MCFSATASFTASIGLGLIGGATLSQVRTPNQYPLASIPLIFAVQQFAEGVVWMSLMNPEWSAYQNIASLIFLLTAIVVWPIWIPLSFVFFEQDKKRKSILKLLLVIGSMASLYFLSCIIFIGFESTIVNRHVFYKVDFPKFMVPIAAAFYLIGSVVPPLWFKDIKIKLIGISLFVSYLIARIFFKPSLISVWCFIAIIIGVLVFLVVREQAMSKKETKQSMSRSMS